MREIKFRALKNGSWRIFDLRHGQRWAKELLHAMADDVKWLELDTPLCQYTCLKDKNGVEIYEGDVVLFDDSIQAQPFGDNPDPGEPRFIQGVVGFGKGSFNAEIQDSVWGNLSLEQAYEEFATIEVIGNIYENPELLK